MGVDNIVIPGGILATWDGPQTADNGAPVSRREAFDVTQVARQRARTLSVSFSRPTPSREDGPRHVENIVINTERSHNPLQQRPASVHGRGRYARPPQRASTIDLVQLDNSRVTGLGTPAKSRPRNGSAPGVLSSVAELQDTYVFQRLGNSRRPNGTNRPTSSNNSLFLDRQTSHATVDPGIDSSPRKTGRSRSNTAQFSTVGVVRRASVAVENVGRKASETLNSALRRTSLAVIYEKAKIRELQLKRSNTAQRSFEYSFYLLLLASIYFVFVGVPLWNGLVLTIYYIFDRKLVVPAGTAAFLGTAFLYAYLPLLLLFEKEPPEHPLPNAPDQIERGRANESALLIPCYKSEKLIGATLEAALKVFPAQNIFVVANGNSPTPLDKTAAVCEKYGVSHTWSPIGSKIVAQYVGCFVAKRFPFVLLIDDDCLLPPNFPVVTERFSPTVKCIGYTIKSVGPDSSKGTLCQQAQDVEYKLSGIQRAFAGKIGSATFPHGAISIWERELLIKTFEAHPGFSVSEDWFFGHVARQLGCRIQMCTAVFVETETPDSIFFSGGGARGGFGEMTIWKQRFFRWNFFFVSGMYYDMAYILCDWKLGWWELGAKIFVFQEVYETLLYLLAPFVLPISFYVRPDFSAYLFAATLALYMVNVLIFNYVHLRARHESVSVLCLLYYTPYKIVLTFVNIASCYYSIWKYAKYFAKRHPKVIEDEKAVAVVLRLEEEAYSAAEKAKIISSRSNSLDSASGIARRFTVTAVGTTLSSVAQQTNQGSGVQGVEIVDFGVVDFANQTVPQLASVPEGETPNEPRPSISRVGGRMPPPVPPSRRPYSWQRTTSNNSSGSNVSPLDERKRLQFPMPPSTPEMTESPLEVTPPAATQRPSPVYVRRSFPTSFFGRSSSDGTRQIRRPTGAPSPIPSPQENLQSFARGMLRRDSSRSSTLTYNIISPPIDRPRPAAVSERHRSSVYSTAQDGDDGWPLRETLSDTDRYISALVEIDNSSRTQRSGDAGRRAMNRLYIAEEDTDEEDFEEEFTVHDRLDGGGRKKRRRMGSGRGRDYDRDDLI